MIPNIRNFQRHIYHHLPSKMGFLTKPPDGKAYEDPSVDRELRSLLPHATGLEDIPRGMLGFWGETWTLGFLDAFS